MKIGHKHARGTAWKMEPDPDGEVRRVWLCNCGQTFPARLGLTGENYFDQAAERGLGRSTDKTELLK
jgi:hypothetical protein